MKLLTITLTNGTEYNVSNGITIEDIVEAINNKTALVVESHYGDGRAIINGQYIVAVDIPR